MNNSMFLISMSKTIKSRKFFLISIKNSLDNKGYSRFLKQSGNMQFLSFKNIHDLSTEQCQTPRSSNWNKLGRQEFF